MTTFWNLYESLHKDRRTSVCVCGEGERDSERKREKRETILNSQIQNHFLNLFLGHENHKQEAGSAGGSLKKFTFCKLIRYPVCYVIVRDKINELISTSKKGLIWGEALASSAILLTRTKQNMSGRKTAVGQEVRSSFKASCESIRALCLHYKQALPSSEWVTTAHHTGFADASEHQHRHRQTVSGKTSKWSSTVSHALTRSRFLAVFGFCL